MTEFSLYAASVGATMIVAYSDLFQKIKTILGINDIKFFSCPQCLGFWFGVLVALVNGANISGCVLFGLGSSLLSLITASILSKLSE